MGISRTVGINYLLVHFSLQKILLNKTPQAYINDFYEFYRKTEARSRTIGRKINLFCKIPICNINLQIKKRMLKSFNC